MDIDKKELHKLFSKPVQKLTDWKQEPDLDDLKNDLQNARTSHDSQLVKINQWRNLIDCTGSETVPKVKGRSSVQPKLIRKQAEWRYSSLTEPFLAADKLFSINPVSFEDKKAAKQNEVILNWQFRTKLSRVKFIDDYIRSAVDEGTVIVRVGWSRHTKMEKEMTPVWEHYPIDDYIQMLAPKITSEMGGDTLQTTETQALAQIDVGINQMAGEMQQGIQEEINQVAQQINEQFQQAVQLRQSNPLEFKMNLPPELQAAVDFFLESGIPNVAVQVGEEEQEIEKVLENRPTVEVLSPDNVYIDPSCNGDLNKALYVITTFEANLAELKKQGRYKNLDQIEWNSPTDPLHDTKTPVGFQIAGESRKKAVVYEYWGFFDIDGDGLLKPIVASWIGNTLIRLELNPFPDEQLPFIVVPYSPVKRELYGEPDAALLGDNQRILGAVTRGIIDLLGRSANAQHGFQKGMLDAVNRRRYENGQDYEFNQGQNPAMALIEHKYPEIPGSALNLIQLQNNEAEALTGVKAFSTGLNSTSYGDVATGIKGVLDAAGRREMAILRRLAQGIIEIGQKIISMNYEFLSEEEIVRVTNTEFVLIERKDLKGNFDLDVDIATIEVDNQKAQDLGFMLQTMGPNMDSQVSMTILSEIAELKRMPELAETLRTWEPQRDEEMEALQREQAQLQVELLKSQIEMNKARTMEAQAQAQESMVNTQEIASGSKHQKAVDLAQAQARGNQNLAITRALTKNRKLDETPAEIEAAIGYNQMVEMMNQVNVSTPNNQASALSPVQQPSTYLNPIPEGPNVGTPRLTNPQEPAPLENTVGSMR